MGVIPARLYLCTSPGEGCQQRRHIRGFRKKFEKQLLFGRCVKALKRVGCRGLWFPGGLDRRCGFHCTAAPIKLFLEPCGVYTAVIVQDVGIPFRDHCGLCVAGVALDGFNVAAAEFELIGRAGVPLRYNNDKPENPSNDGRFEGLSHLFHSFSNHEKAGQKS